LGLGERTSIDRDRIAELTFEPGNYDIGLKHEPSL
jgi:hypothetical protein